MLPKEKQLPAPSDRYFEIETAKLHGGWLAWEQLDPQRRAELTAHELAKNMRDHYHFDVRVQSGEKDVKKPEGLAPWDLIQRRFFEGGMKK